MLHFLHMQAAFMAPTELLAIQHYEQLRDLLEKMEGVPSKPTIGLLTGSTPTKQSRMIRQVTSRFILYIAISLL